MTTIATAHALHIGGRDEQQDAATILHSGSGPDQEVLLVLADGMGGHAGGQIASSAVVATAERLWTDGTDRTDPGAFLRKIFSDAHEEINRAGEEKGLSPRSTGVLVYLHGGKATWTHIGDSRLYRFRGDKLLGRTHDHSVVQMLRDMGKITEEEMGTHPDQNRLTHSLGGETDPDPDIETADIKPGDSFVLCSDGLWEMITPDEMADAAAGTLKERVGDLAVEANKRAGAGSDNISVVIARVDKAAAAAAAVPASAKAGPRRTGRTSVLAFLLVTVIAAGAVAGILQPWKAERDEAGAGAAKKSGAVIPTKQSTGKEAESRKSGLPDKKAEPQKTPETKTPEAKTPETKNTRNQKARNGKARRQDARGDQTGCEKAEGQAA